LNATDPLGLDKFYTVSPRTAVVLGRILNGAGDADELLKAVPLPKIGNVLINVLDGLGMVRHQGDQLIQAAKDARNKAAKRTGIPRGVPYVTIDVHTLSILGHDTGIPTTFFNATGGARRPTKPKR
jgi:hypothetical protein